MTLRPTPFAVTAGAHSAAPRGDEAWDMSFIEPGPFTTIVHTGLSRM